MLGYKSLCTYQSFCYETLELLAQSLAELSLTSPSSLSLNELFYLVIEGIQSWEISAAEGTACIREGGITPPCPNTKDQEVNLVDAERVIQV